MVSNDVKVKVVYRNYIPLYSGYCSFWLSKLPGIEVSIPPVKSELKSLLKLYRLIRKIPFFSIILNAFQKVFFDQGNEEKDIDLYFYAGLLPPKNMKKLFVVDFENVHSLFNFSEINENIKKEVLDNLSRNECKKILPWSKAAEGTIKEFYKEDYSLLKEKVEVLYPALPLYKEKYSRHIDYSIVKKDDKKLKLLFVGGDMYRKGLHEVLAALDKLNKTRKEDFEFYCVTRDTEDLKKKYTSGNYHFYPFAFQHEEVMKKFFMTCDLFVMPTHEDTFGMVFLEALSCGLPVITTKQFATPEIVQEGINGFFVDSDILFLNNFIIPPKDHDASQYRGIEKKLVTSIVQKIEYIFENPEVLGNMKIRCLEDFREGGKFSISERNKKLERIIKEAVNDEKKEI